MKLCPVCGSQYQDDVKFCPNDGQTLRAAAPATDLVGQVVADRYHIIKKLGEGGMGQVYLGEHVKMGRRSAIKVMNPSMVHDPDAVARFNREAANASRITHPHVCAIYDFGETPEGLIYLAMEFIEGEPLTDLLDREDALPVDRATRIFLQTADALQAAHDLGIVHRDLKPDNIMVSRGRDGSDLVKVVDFGIAKAVGGDEAGQKVTKTGLVVGTPEFMSPEQLAGDKVDGRSDLYALALVYFRMLTGRLPFVADTVQETMIKRLTDEPTKLAAARPDLTFPPGLQAVLDSALTRSPVDRYQSVSKFADDAKAVTGLGGSTRGIPVTRAAAASEGATQLLDTSATRQMGARAPAATRPSKAPRRSFVPLIIGAVVVLGGGGAGVILLSGNKGGANASGADSTQHTTSPVDTPKTVSRDTARHRPESTPGTRRPAIDSAAIDRELLAMIDETDPSKAAGLRARAQDIYDLEDMPKNLRVQAALTVATFYGEARNQESACRWAGYAARLDPSNRNVRAMQDQQGCS